MINNCCYYIINRVFHFLIWKNFFDNNSIQKINILKVKRDCLDFCLQGFVIIKLLSLLILLLLNSKNFDDLLFESVLLLLLLLLLFFYSF